jgi:sugar phosphate isomerase/epimerase
MTHSSRRNFLRSSALLAAAAGTGCPIHAALLRLGWESTGHAGSPITGIRDQEAQLTPSPIHLGLCSYTFRNFTRAQLIAFMKQLRVTALNAKDAKDHLPADPAAESQAISDYAANGIHLHAAGAIYFQKDDDADIRAKFEYAKRAGIKVIVAGDPAPATLPRVEKFVKEYDIRIAIHNHGPEDKIFPSPLDVLKFVRNMDPRMGCCIDVGHCVRAGTDVIEAIHAAGPRLFNMHMKDLASFTEKESQVAVGEGKMPIRQIFEALIKINYPGFVDLEYEVHGDDPMPGVIASFSYMRGVLSGMGYNSPAAE